MRIVQKKIKGESANIYYEQFESYQEFLKIVEERDRTNAHGHHTLRENVGDWNGVKTYEEAKDLLMNGWEAKVEYLKKCVEKEIDTIDQKRLTKVFNDVVGFMPVVPMAIMNLPNCMLNVRQSVKKQKVIKFLIDRTFGCGVNSDDAIKYFSKVLARISVLEKNGYRCRIEILQNYSSESWSKTRAMFSMLIKSENQLFDIKRMAFPIAHTSMFRTFGFAWENSLPIAYESYHQSTLGRGWMYWNKTSRERMLDALNEANEKTVYVHYNKDLDEIFGKEVI
jgi:hypothetical protein